MARSPTGPPRRARLSVSAAFLIYAAVFGSWAPRIPDVKHALGLSDGQLGVALMGQAAGALIGTRLAGRALERVGSRPAIRVGLVALCAMLPAPALAGSLPLLTAALLLLGGLGGFLDVAMNAQGVAVERAYGRPVMSGLHALFSGGVLLAAAAATAAAQAAVRPSVHFALVGAVLAASSVAALSGLLPIGPEASGARGVGDRTSPPGWLQARDVLLLGVIPFCAVFVEGAAEGWAAVYVRDDLGTGPGAAGGVFVAFSATMTGGRLLGDRLSARFGPVAVVRVGSLLAAGGLALGLALNRPLGALLGFALLGAGLASVVPIAFSAAGNIDARSGSVMLGRAVTMAYLGSIIGPLLVGGAADRVGLPLALGQLVVLTLVVAVLAGTVAAAPGGEGGCGRGWSGSVSTWLQSSTQASQM